MKTNDINKDIVYRICSDTKILTLKQKSRHLQERVLTNVRILSS